MLQGNDLDGCTTEERGSGGRIEEKERRKEMGKEKNDEYVKLRICFFIKLMSMARIFHETSGLLYDYHTPINHTLGIYLIHMINYICKI